MNESALGDELAGILADLIAIPSPYPPGDSVAISAYAADRLRRAGYRTAIMSEEPGVDNVVASLGEGAPHLVFNAHSDTVAMGDRGKWATDPYRAERSGDRIHGLGAGNCKGSMAVQLWLAEEIARRGGPRRGTVTFTFVADEENLGPHGMAFLRQAGHVRPDVLILGAQTENQMIVAERGVLWARVATTGRAAHAGNPAAGDSAILRLARLLAALEANLVPALDARRDGAMQSTINVGLIEGGSNANVVPSAAAMTIDRRLLPAEKVDAAFAELHAILSAAGEPDGSWTLEKLTGTNGFRAAADGPGVTALGAAIAGRTGAPARLLNATGVSDGRYFADDGIEIVNFGPGSGAEGHAANESVPLSQMVDSAAILLDAVRRLTGSQD
ncbi:acetylornithine deacetylase/succinyl-diaminopimelate desuccinylase [Stella humosa]|uniref:Acetylornithine deacetylase/succinyl-diaminopimelate desuccinylase n=1 Tax=Stella humosa TaxID=94 RepID=A0A3N1MDW1_9PROT|nr:ArgE/DapE family deacylase [Stella humosa]ROQ01921.1 acetylornithine deacetylase/succinyl-diaminopimelate desuccinylase [Stella humosa]BBK32310.1 succinyl-diaminopimelate desuccinylase [Stella humosa]